MNNDQLSRDEYLLQIRPPVTFLADQALVMERFQGEVLRPILKFQNDWLLRRIATYLKHHYPDFSSLQEKQQKSILDESVKTNQLFRTELIGSIYGLFTSEEMKMAERNQTDIRKRIVSLMVERFQTQIDKIKTLLQTLN